MRAEDLEAKAWRILCDSPCRHTPQALPRHHLQSPSLLSADWASGTMASSPAFWWALRQSGLPAFCMSSASFDLRSGGGGSRFKAPREPELDGRPAPRAGFRSSFKGGGALADGAGDVPPRRSTLPAGTPFCTPGRAAGPGAAAGPGDTGPGAAGTAAGAVGGDAGTGGGGAGTGGGGTGAGGGGAGTGGGGTGAGGGGAGTGGGGTGAGGGGAGTGGGGTGAGGGGAGTGGGGTGAGGGGAGTGGAGSGAGGGGAGTGGGATRTGGGGGGTGTSCSDGSADASG